MRKHTKYIYYSILILPVVIYYWILSKYSVNAPINDDYRAILDSVNKIISVDSYTEKIKILFHNIMNTE